MSSSQESAPSGLSQPQLAVRKIGLTILQTPAERAVSPPLSSLPTQRWLHATPTGERISSRAAHVCAGDERSTADRPLRFGNEPMSCGYESGCEGDRIRRADGPWKELRVVLWLGTNRGRQLELDLELTTSSRLGRPSYPRGPLCSPPISKDTVHISKDTVHHDTEKSKAQNVTKHEAKNETSTSLSLKRPRSTSRRPPAPFIPLRPSPPSSPSSPSSSPSSRPSSASTLPVVGSSTTQACSSTPVLQPASSSRTWSPPGHSSRPVALPTRSPARRYRRRTCRCSCRRGIHWRRRCSCDCPHTHTHTHTHTHIAVSSSHSDSLAREIGEVGGKDALAVWEHAL